MKIFSASQIRAWDVYTIENEPITSLALMNRAVQVLVEWIQQHYNSTRPVVIVCGTGNNGGDGIAAACQLTWLGFDAKVVVCDFAGKRSPDFDAQFEVLQSIKSVPCAVVRSFPEFENYFKQIGSNVTHPPLLIDALFGSGLNRPLEGEWGQTIDLLNQSGLEILAVDVPSGLLADGSTKGQRAISATRTFSFERPKLAFFMPENAERVGEWHFGSIGLHPDYERITDTPFHFLTPKEAGALRRERSKFSHKGSFGHALLISGSYGKMGAAVLAARGCLRAGVGLLTVHAPEVGLLTLQASVPEAMFSADVMRNVWSNIPDLRPYAAIGVGPGIGKATETIQALGDLLQSCNGPLVMDADALNILAENPDLWEYVPENALFTPHPKEFERLFGKAGNDFQRIDLLLKMAKERRLFILLKGAHTAIACPDGTCWFNTTGNPGMATGGSGDVLTGILTGLLAQGYGPKSAALLGVYLHGLAGDLAAAEKSQEGMIAGDLCEFLGTAWLKLGNGN